MDLPTPVTEDAARLLEQVVVHGDLAKLSPAERLAYYQRVCESLGLNPLTGPFRYIVLSGRLTLYATRDAADQLRKIHRVSIRITSRELVGDVYVVTAQAQLPDGRTDEAIGAVSLAGLRGDALANAYMKAETKAKRRVTLSMVGLGWLDETEVEDLPPGTAAAWTEPDAPGGARPAGTRPSPAAGASDGPAATDTPTPPVTVSPPETGAAAPPAPTVEPASAADAVGDLETQYEALLRDLRAAGTSERLIAALTASAAGNRPRTDWTPDIWARVVEQLQRLHRQRIGEPGQQIA
ncbi:MAG: hypothetical protein K6V97_11345 [Actinomycetia bacterium]|nr:hypothetical protein [Actinomycetes bacterium]